MRLIDTGKINYPEFLDTPYKFGRDFGIKYVKEIIDSAPTVDTEPVRHAHWIEKKYVANNRYYAVCSNCKEEYPHESDSLFYITSYGFCPHCGAKMDKEYEL